MAYSCYFGLSGNLEFPDFLQKSFIKSTTGLGQGDPGLAMKPGLRLDANSGHVDSFDRGNNAPSKLA